ncbi:uncharacterized protein LOC120887838 [Ictidomys tridecemlineatus]
MVLLLLRRWLAGGPHLPDALQDPRGRGRGRSVPETAGLGSPGRLGPPAPGRAPFPAVGEKAGRPRADGSEQSLRALESERTLVARVPSTAAPSTAAPEGKRLPLAGQGRQSRVPRPNLSARATVSRPLSPAGPHSLCVPRAPPPQHAAAAARARGSWGIPGRCAARRARARRTAQGAARAAVARSRALPAAGVRSSSLAGRRRRRRRRLGLLPPAEGGCGEGSARRGGRFLEGRALPPGAAGARSRSEPWQARGANARGPNPRVRSLPAGAGRIAAPRVRALPGLLRLRVRHLRARRAPRSGFRRGNRGVGSPRLRGSRAPPAASTPGAERRGAAPRGDGTGTVLDLLEQH